MYVNEERKHKGIECKLCRKLWSLFFFRLLVLLS